MPLPCHSTRGNPAHTWILFPRAINHRAFMHASLSHGGARFARGRFIAYRSSLQHARMVRHAVADTRTFCGVTLPHTPPAPRATCTHYLHAVPPYPAGASFSLTLLPATLPYTYHTASTPPMTYTRHTLRTTPHTAGDTAGRLVSRSTSSFHFTRRISCAACLFRRRLPDGTGGNSGFLPCLRTHLCTRGTTHYAACSRTRVTRCTLPRGRHCPACLPYRCTTCRRLPAIYCHSNALPGTPARLPLLPLLRGIVVDVVPSRAGILPQHIPLRRGSTRYIYRLPFAPNTAPPCVPRAAATVCCYGTARFCY